MLATLSQVVDSYILSHELAPQTIGYYRRCASVFRRWLGNDDAEQFTVETCNRFLLAMQEAGYDWPYRKSLRSGLRALLGHIDRVGKLRPVKSRPLEPESWTESEVAKLVAAAPSDWWRTIIEVAWWTGLNQCDLQQLEKRHFLASGELTWWRQKTGQQVIVAIPAELLARLPATGLCWGRPFSGEYFRRRFRQIALAAGLVGTFKKLRKSSGTSVEALHPGCGHIHLGNTRRVFEIHYLDRAKGIKPLPPAMLRRSDDLPA